jgi:hypothetical protein
VRQQLSLYEAVVNANTYMFTPKFPVTLVSLEQDSGSHPVELRRGISTSRIPEAPTRGISSPTATFLFQVLLVMGKWTTQPKFRS